MFSWIRRILHCLLINSIMQNIYSIVHNQTCHFYPGQRQYSSQIISSKCVPYYFRNRPLLKRKSKENSRLRTRISRRSQIAATLTWNKISYKLRVDYNMICFLWNSKVYLWCRVKKVLFHISIISNCLRNSFIKASKRYCISNVAWMGSLRSCIRGSWLLLLLEMRKKRHRNSLRRVCLSRRFSFWVHNQWSQPSYERLQPFTWYEMATAS